MNIWSKDWRPECSKGSVNQYSLLLDRLRLISKKFVSYNDQVPPPMCLPSVYLTSSHMIKSSRSSLSIYAYQKLEPGRSWELFMATFVLCSRAGSFTGYLGMRLGRNHYRCLFVCLFVVQGFIWPMPSISHQLNFRSIYSKKGQLVLRSQHSILCLCIPVSLAQPGTDGTSNMTMTHC